MGFLTEIQKKTVEAYGMEFGVNPSFDTVLLISRLFDEEELTEEDKVAQALKMLVTFGKTEQLNINQKSELLRKIYEQCVHVPKKTPIRQSTPVLDFDYDGEYIYSSFLMDYGIDLIEQQGILTWKKFIALFQGLSSKTKIREVMRIREMKIPAYNGKNSEEIREIQELKSFYALPVRGGGGAKGLDALFSALEKMAKN